MNPLVILSGGKDALLTRETFVTDLGLFSQFPQAPFDKSNYIYIYIYIIGFVKRCLRKL